MSAKFDKCGTCRLLINWDHLVFFGDAHGHSHQSIGIVRNCAQLACINGLSVIEIGYGLVPRWLNANNPWETRTVWISKQCLEIALPVLAVSRSCHFSHVVACFLQPVPPLQLPCLLFDRQKPVCNVPPQPELADLIDTEKNSLH